MYITRIIISSWLVTGLLFSMLLHGQNRVVLTETLDWQHDWVNVPHPEQEGKITKSCTFTQATFDYQTHILPIYGKKIRIGATGKLQVRIENAQYAPLND